jgi:hypothetical protein
MMSRELFLSAINRQLISISYLKTVRYVLFDKEFLITQHNWKHLKICCNISLRVKGDSSSFRRERHHYSFETIG